MQAVDYFTPERQIKKVELLRQLKELYPNCKFYLLIEAPFPARAHQGNFLNTEVDKARLKSIVASL